MAKLWTAHAPDFSLTEGKIVHAKSHFYTNANGLTRGIKDAYHKLWQKIGRPDGQIIWCYTVCKFPRDVSKVVWCLEVPEEAILFRIDDIAWNKIIRQPLIRLPRGRENEWNRRPRTGDWWDELLIDDNASDYLRSALILHPIPEAWIEKKILRAAQPAN
jgi:hypothetical protein